MTENEYDDDLEAKMSHMFGDESKENKARENVRRSSRTRKKITYSNYESDPDLSELTNGKKSKKTATLHNVVKKDSDISIEYYKSEDSDDVSDSFEEEEYSHNKQLKNKSNKRGRPKSSGSKPEGEIPKKKLKNLASGNRSGYRGAGKKGSGGYFMKGDLMWYVAIKRGLKKTSPEQGIKGYQQSALSNLPRDQHIIMELRVALDDTRYLEKNKKYQTRCISIATAPFENEQDSDNDFDCNSTSDVDSFQNGIVKKKSLKKKTIKPQKSMLSGSLTGHEKLHEHFDEPQELIKFLLELKSVNNQKDHQAIEDQLGLHERIRRAEIYNEDEKILYYTGEFLVFHFLLYFIM
jgi:hypothetical protein